MNRQRRRLRTRFGLTLVEVAITTAVLAVVAATLVAVLVHSLRAFSAGTSQQAALDSAAVALQKISAEIRDGSSAVVQSGVLTVRFPVLLTDSSSDERAYDFSAAGQVTRSYFVQNGRLVRNAGGSVSVLMEGIDSAEFTVSLGSVRITLVGASRAGSVGSTQSVSGTVALRNYRG